MAVYLLHFNEKISHAQHYLGFTENLERRLREHRNGRAGAGIVAAFKRQNIEFEVARVWDEGTRELERHLKTVYKRATKLCPICRKRRAAK